MDPTDERLWLKVLLAGCPLEEAVDECPIRRFRDLAPTDAHRLLGDMAGADVHSLLQHHKTCRRQREGASGFAGAG